MCCYKLVKVECTTWMVGSTIEGYIKEAQRELFTLFHRQLLCRLDQWHGMTMSDIRELEEKTKHHLNKIVESEVKGMCSGLSLRWCY